MIRKREKREFIQINDVLSMIIVISEVFSRRALHSYTPLHNQNCVFKFEFDFEQLSGCHSPPLPKKSTV
jgi:hypothetical protein